MTIRLTKKRQAILDYLRTHHGTHAAAAIHAALPDTDLTTVYRTLELFTAEKLIKQLHFTGSEAQYEHQTEPHHHAVCTKCDRIIHFGASDKKLQQLLQINNFAITDFDITVRGQCTKTHTK